MQRSLAPARQVEEVARFVRESGGTPKHSAVLELVARLNGAPNWNELNRKGLPEEKPAPAAALVQVVEPQGFIREVDKLTTSVYFIGATMFDESEPWQLMEDNESRSHVRRELSDKEMELIGREGVVVGAVVEYPRADRYGLPDVALTRGLLEWLHDEQGMPTVKPEEFELYSHDSEDDSAAFCILEVRLPKRFTL